MSESPKNHVAQKKWKKNTEKRRKFHFQSENLGAAGTNFRKTVTIGHRRGRHPTLEVYGNTKCLLIFLASIFIGGDMILIRRFRN